MVRLLSYNICRGGKGRESQIATVISAAAPDLVLLQEATDPAIVEQIAARCGMVECAARRGESLGFMSRASVDGYQWHRPLISRHAFLEVAVNAKAELRVFGVHLSAVHAGWTERRRTLELRALLGSIKQHQHGFHVLAGDFNTLAPGELLDVGALPARLRALVWLSGGKIRFRTIKAVLDAGYVDIYRSLRGSDPGLTFPSWGPHVRLDYVFAPAAYSPRLHGCEIVHEGPVRDASDHLPLVVDIDLDVQYSAWLQGDGGPAVEPRVLEP